MQIGQLSSNRVLVTLQDINKIFRSCEGYVRK